MFAVPGWNLAARTVAQDQPKASKDRNKHSLGSEASSQNGKKRKHSGKDDRHDKKRSKEDASRASEIGSSHRTRPVPNDAFDRHRKERRPSTGQNSKQINGNRPDKVNKQHNTSRRGQIDVKTSPPPPPPTKLVPLSSAPSNANLTPLQAKMRAKLTSARFRHLNETLYTTDSTSAMTLFTSSPELFTEYHAGFSQQVKDSWPQNPVDDYIAIIKARSALAHPKASLQPLPRRKTGSCTIADLGCGDAPLARNLKSACNKFSLRIHSFDLHAPNDLVTKADITNVPLRDGEADIAIFCLSLMGTNWLSFVEEAWRILRGDGKGELWVAEVKSRFGRPGKSAAGRVVDNSVGKKRKPQSKRQDEDDGGDDRFVEDTRDASQQDETDISAFVQVFQRRGFVLREESVEKSNKMFVRMVFVKSGVPSAGKHKGMKWNGEEYRKLEGKAPNKKFGASQGRGQDEEVDEKEEAKVLKPCVYKTR